MRKSKYRKLYHLGQAARFLTLAAVETVTKDESSKYTYAAAQLQAIIDSQKAKGRRHDTD